MTLLGKYCGVDRTKSRVKQDIYQNQIKNQTDSMQTYQ